jgi:hypothetical protein
MNNRRSIVVSQDLWDKIVTAAKKDDRSISSWIRKAVEYQVWAEKENKTGAK